MIREVTVPVGVHEGAPGLRVELPGDTDRLGDLTGDLLDALRPNHVAYELHPPIGERLLVAQALLSNLAGRASWALPWMLKSLGGPWPRFRCHLIIDPSDLVGGSPSAADLARRIGDFGPRPRPEAIAEIVLRGVEPNPVELDTVAHIIAPAAWLTLYVEREKLRDARVVAQHCTYSWRVRPLDAIQVED